MKFSSSSDVFAWLSKFINLERGQTPKSFNPKRMEFLTELAGNPERCAPSIHIAGSKGKGSVTGMITAILTAEGFRTARYMSPHVIDIRERICLGSSYFSEDIYCTAGDELRKAENRCTEFEPTFWELLTLYFFLCAKHANCDVIVAETGMGGRLDSTNVLDPLVSVITLIELEHTNFLGNTIAEVAGEKAGIIKQGKPLILAKQESAALEVFKKKAKEKNSPLLYFPEIAELSDITVHGNGTDFTVCFKSANSALESTLALSIPIPGKVQAENAALAIAAVKTAFPHIDENTICSGVKNLNIPARFEKLPHELPFIIDGAHTPESLELCIETFCSLYGEGGVLIFGCAADKDAAAMARIAIPHFSKIFITTPGTFKISNPPLVYDAFAELEREKTQLILDTQEAVKQAVRFAKKTCKNDKSLPILGTGSFYLVSEIRKNFQPNSMF